MLAFFVFASSTIIRKDTRSSDQSTVSVAAVMVAVRGQLYMSASSPKQPPGPLSVGALFLSFELDPVGTLLPGGGPLYLPISGPLIDGGVFTVASGFGATLLNLPGGFPGFLVTMQAAVIDSSPLGFTLSNAGALLTQ